MMETWVKARERLEHATLLALKMDEGVHKPGSVGSL